MVCQRVTGYVPSVETPTSLSEPHAICASVVLLSQMKMYISDHNSVNLLMFLVFWMIFS